MKTWLSNAWKETRPIEWAMFVVAVAGSGLVTDVIAGANGLRAITVRVLSPPFSQVAVACLFLLIAGVIQMILTRLWPPPYSAGRVSAWTRWRKLRTGTSFDVKLVVEGSLVFLNILNYGPDTEFTGEVVGVQGALEAFQSPHVPSAPWPVEWRNYMFPHRFVSSELPHRLVLAQGDGLGNLATRQPGASPSTGGRFLFHLASTDSRPEAHLDANLRSDQLYTKELRVSVNVVGVGVNTVSRTVCLGFERTLNSVTGNLKIRAKFAD